MKMILKSKRARLGLVAAACIAVAAFVGLADRSQAEPTADPTAPAWLSAQLPSELAFYFNDATPDSVEVGNTTLSQYEVAVGEEPSPSEAAADHAAAKAEVPAIVVVARGDFTASFMTAGNSAPPTGNVLVITYDPITHEEMTIALLNEGANFNPAALGKMSPVALSK